MSLCSLDRQTFKSFTIGILGFLSVSLIAKVTQFNFQEEVQTVPSEPISIEQVSSSTIERKIKKEEERHNMFGRLLANYSINYVV